MNRRRFCAAALSGAMAGMLPGAPARAQARTVTDMAGRAVTLNGVPRRIVLLEAHDIVTMSFLHPDPASLVVGWAAADRIDSAALQARFEGRRRPDGRPIAEVGKQAPGSVSLEGILQLKPDLVVASSFMASQADGGGVVQRLQGLGIPVVFSDVSSNAAEASRAGPGETLHRQMRMWGGILGAPGRAAAYAAYVDERLAGVAQRLADAPRVTTYLEVQSTLNDCCWAAGTQVWGELLALAGGRTLPGVTAPWFQKLQLEYLLSTPHDVYIASGGGWASGGRPAIGPGLDPAEGRAGLQRLVARQGFAGLASTRHHRVHGIWTGLIAVVPLNLLFVEVAAKWLHPERCRDLDPAQTLADINRRFLGTPIDGPLWASIQE
ncbi:ferrichrome/ferrioxamine B periplasmic transporter [Bordetella ansorpii]|uniref:Ferrichrome/ferrioxamine B periplasmic transporter n=1 Tax=Bordetella ansorpii TaxID=288768 RepID=A0A157LGZ2_9BORD|nr:ABC transporter substrate-binding protein [Bordetella ansorpii]SAH95987.1 ferrichrome/ferrioxamine B periplasmic transporter [Bordetella ansorpii]